MVGSISYTVLPALRAVPPVRFRGLSLGRSLFRPECRRLGDDEGVWAQIGSHTTDMTTRRGTYGEPTECRRAWAISMLVFHSRARPANWRVAV